MHKIAIVGAGSVGAAIANDLMLQGVASEIVLIDINRSKALGEALDIYHGSPFCTPIRIVPGDYSDAKNSDIVIITSGVARKPGQTRMELAQTNVNILKSIAPQIVTVAPNAIYIIVSNPVDILAYAFQKLTGLPDRQILGTGTILDTCRLQATLAQKCGISARDIQAYVFGGHGELMFIPWSLLKIQYNPVELYCKMNSAFDYDEIEAIVRDAGTVIIENKGATYYAIAVAVCHICKCIFNGIDASITVSSMLHGEYGITDVCLSTLTQINCNGVIKKIVNPLNDREIEKLHSSAETLKTIIRQIEF